MTAVADTVVTTKDVTTRTNSAATRSPSGCSAACSPATSC